MMKHLGIDYGAKLAGTTVICVLEGDFLRWIQSEKKKDADAFLKAQAKQLQPDKIFLDAPLSLPGVYTGRGNNYFYREADLQTGAMSPMFLGGLTARAMQLKANFEKWDIEVWETYPGGLVRQILPGKELYQKRNSAQILAFWEQLQLLLPYPAEAKPTNWHQVDAALAWFSGWRMVQGRARITGNAQEGQIVL